MQFAEAGSIQWYKAHAHMPVSIFDEYYQIKNHVVTAACILQTRIPFLILWLFNCAISAKEALEGVDDPTFATAFV